MMTIGVPARAASTVAVPLATIAKSAWHSALYVSPWITVTLRSSCACAPLLACACWIGNSTCSWRIVEARGITNCGALDCGLRIADCGISDFKFKISDFGFEISELGFKISDFRFEISDFRFEISEFGFEISELGFEISELGFELSPLRSEI